MAAAKQAAKAKAAKRSRDAVTGRRVTQQEAKARPREVVQETVRKRKP
jgi:hypothetical protein